MWELTPEWKSAHNADSHCGLESTKRFPKIPKGPTAVPSQDAFFREAAVHLIQIRRQTREGQLWSSLRTMRTGRGILQRCRGRGLKCRPLPQTPSPARRYTERSTKLQLCPSKTVSVEGFTPPNWEQIGNRLGTNYQRTGVK